MKDTERCAGQAPRVIPRSRQKMESPQRHGNRGQQRPLEEGTCRTACWRQQGFKAKKDEPRDGEAGAKATVLHGLAMLAPRRSPGPSPWTVASRLPHPHGARVLEPRPDAGPVSQAAGGVQAHSSLQGVQSTEQSPGLLSIFWKPKSSPGMGTGSSTPSSQARPGWRSAGWLGEIVKPLLPRPSQALSLPS